MGIDDGENFVFVVQKPKKKCAGKHAQKHAEQHAENMQKNMEKNILKWEGKHMCFSSSWTQRSFTLWEL